MYNYILRVSFGLRDTKECSKSYRQSKMYNRAKYLKNLLPKSVSSNGNLQVVDKFRKHASFFYAQGGNMGMCGYLDSMHLFHCLGCLPEICFCVGRPKLFPIFY